MKGGVALGEIAFDMSTTRRDYRVILLHCFRSGKSATAALTELQQSIGPDAPSHNTVYNWYHRFESGDFSVEDRPRQCASIRTSFSLRWTSIQKRVYVSYLQ